MNSATKFSLRLALVAFFACATFGQGLAKPTLANSSGHSVISYTMTSTFLLKPRDIDTDRAGKKCDSNDLYDSKKKCAAMPEGGHALMYILLASLTCFGAIALGSRRKTGARGPV